MEWANYDNNGLAKIYNIEKLLPHFQNCSGNFSRSVTVKILDVSVVKLKSDKNPKSGTIWRSVG